MEGSKPSTTSGSTQRAKQTTYPPPPIPDTPSRTINDTLHARFGAAHSSPVKAVLAKLVCGFFTAVDLVYQYIHGNQRQHSHTKWMVACGAVSTVIVISTVLLYNIVISAAWVLHSLLYYAAWSLCLLGIGLGVSGAVFFDKDGNVPSKPQPGSFKADFYEDKSQ